MIDRPTQTHAAPAFPRKLWLYTNFDCNLRCSYCVARSGPDAPRRALGLANVKRLVDEAVDLAFDELFFTGGEPFLLDDIYEMLAYASAKAKTTVLTNAMILRGARLDRLCAIANDRLVVQVSLDGGRPADHDPLRGRGSWEETVEGIRLLQERGFRVRLSTTETPANRDRLDELCAFHRGLGIPDEDHLVRPLAKRGFSRDGLELDRTSLIPEVTVTVDGVFWHPLSTDADMQVNRTFLPLANSVTLIRDQLESMVRSGGATLRSFT